MAKKSTQNQFSVFGTRPDNAICLISNRQGDRYLRPNSDRQSKIQNLKSQIEMTTTTRLWQLSEVIKELEDAIAAIQEDVSLIS